MAQKKTRRSFLDWLIRGGLTAWMASIFYPVLRYMVPPDVPDININRIEVGELSDFPRSSSKIIRMGRTPVLVIRKKSGNFKALEATCTHLDCNVQFKTDTEQIWCACHNGLYDIEGRNISGPPPKPLGQFDVAIQNEKIIVTKPELA
ncbi:MAG: Rieske (2Fe-2S) protein [Candidatus Marinimicrobia bacterium]|nr:Rieske (2Fe-2S) protein [Candidatus Neomarinimicrobiota bacterium]MBL7031455.1 Rieske (2Fe-2S) protein [Candidatus Neomarinimicrobiota bacterium]